MKSGRRSSNNSYSSINAKRKSKTGSKSRKAQSLDANSKNYKINAEQNSKIIECHQNFGESPANFTAIMMNDAVDLTNFWNDNPKNTKRQKKLPKAPYRISLRTESIANCRDIVRDYSHSVESMINHNYCLLQPRETPFPKLIIDRTIQEMKISRYSSMSKISVSPSIAENIRLSPPVRRNSVIYKPEKVKPILIPRLPKVGDSAFSIMNVIDEIKMKGKGYILEPIKWEEDEIIIKKRTRFEKLPATPQPRVRTRSNIWGETPAKLAAKNTMELSDYLQLDASMQYVKEHPDKLSDDEYWDSYIDDYVERHTKKARPLAPIL